mgnify:CR=1 FL=1
MTNNNIFNNQVGTPHSESNILLDKLCNSYKSDDFLMLTTKKTELKEKQLFDTIFSILNIENSKIVRIKQTHSNHVKYVIESGFYNNYDGIISNSL